MFHTFDSLDFCRWLVWRVASVYFFATTAFVGIVLFGCGLKQLATFGQLSRKAAIGTTVAAALSCLSFLR